MTYKWNWHHSWCKIGVYAPPVLFLLIMNEIISHAFKGMTSGIRWGFTERHEYYILWMICTCFQSVLLKCKTNCQTYKKKQTSLKRWIRLQEKRWVQTAVMLKIQCVLRRHLVWKNLHVHAKENEAYVPLDPVWMATYQWNKLKFLIAMLKAVLL